MLTISVKNFGPIAEGSVDLKPLTIFVGPSNTGKSYMATAVYAVMQGFERPYRWGYTIDELRRESGQRLLQWHARSGRKLVARNEGRDAVEALVKWASQLREDEINPREIFWSDLSSELQSEMEHSIQLMLGSIATDVVEKISDTFGEPPSFVRRGTANENSGLEIKRCHPVLDVGIQLAGDDQPLPVFDISSIPIRQPYLEAILNREESNERSDIAPIAGSMVFLTFLDSAVEPLFAEFPLRSYYLPAARSGIVIVHKPLSASLIRQGWSVAKTRGPSHITLPTTATDFLSELVSLDRRMAAGRDDQSLNRAIEFIESEVLLGKIDIDESDGLPLPEIVYLPTPEGGLPTSKFTLNQTSSMVSELAPLILFLKYLVNPGDLLILEEPESHLHPAAQMQMARGIARLVNAGVKILITTHSGDFMGQINNLISMSNVSEKTGESQGLEQAECLYPEQVSAYGFRFDSDRGGSVTYPLPVGSDVGIEDEEFLPVSELLYEQAITFQRNRLT